MAAYYAAQKELYGQDIDLSNDSERLQLFAKIMTHGMEYRGDENSKNYKPLEEHFKSQGIDPELYQLPIGKWAAKLDKVSLVFDDKTNGLKRSVNKVLYDGNWNGENAGAKIDAIDYIISKGCRNASVLTYDADSGSLKALIDDLHEDAVNERKVEAKIAGEITNVEDQNSALQAMMLKSINVDIVNLRDITVNAVVKALNLEKAFISVITDNVEFIRKDAEDTSNQGKFDAWINDNKIKIRNNEYARIERNKMDNITRRNIIENIDYVLKGLKV